MDDYDEGYKWTRIDEIEMRALPLLGEGDTCYYFLNRVSGGFRASSTNDRIDDFKKSLRDFSGRPDVLRYKEDEIDRFAQDLARFLGTEDIRFPVEAFDTALVPMPTSSPVDDEFYDDRLVRLCEKAAEINRSVRVADVLHSKKRLSPSHQGGPRDVETITDNLSFKGFGNEIPDVVILVDDVLTTGAHYVSCRNVIRRNYPGVLLIGAFLCIHRSDYVDYAALGIDY